MSSTGIRSCTVATKLLGSVMIMVQELLPIGFPPSIPGKIDTPENSGSTRFYWCRVRGLNSRPTVYKGAVIHCLYWIISTYVAYVSRLRQEELFDLFHFGAVVFAWE